MGVVEVTIPLQTLDDEIEEIRRLKIEPVEQEIREIQKKLFKQEAQLARLESSRVQAPIDLLEGLLRS